MANPKDYKELKEHHTLLSSVARMSDLPIGRVLAITINRMQHDITKLEEPVDKLIEEYCVTDEKGERLGVEYDKPGEKPGDATTKARRDLSNGVYPYEWIEIKKGKKAEFDKKLKALLARKVEFKYSPIKIDNREVSTVVPRSFKNAEGVETVHNVEVRVPMIEVLEKKLPVLTLAFLLDTVITYTEELK